MNDTARLEYLMALYGLDRPTIDARIAARTEPETRPLPLVQPDGATREQLNSQLFHVLR